MGCDPSLTVKVISKMWVVVRVTLGVEGWPGGAAEQHRNTQQQQAVIIYHAIKSLGADV